MALTSPYLTTNKLDKLFSEVNLDSLEEIDKQELIDTAIGDMESRLNKRFMIPLKAKGGSDLASAPAFAVQKIRLTAVVAIRRYMAQEYLRNSDLNNLGDYEETQEKFLRGHIKDLLDFENDFNLELKPYAQDAVEPVQHVGIARANNDMSTDYEE